MIYFMQPVDGGPIKIGYSKNVDRRRKQLELRYSRKLVVLATRRGFRRAEVKIHKQFSHLRIGITEQFQPGPDLLDFIGKPLLVSANSDLVEPMGVVLGKPGPKPTGTSIRTERLVMLCRPEYKSWAEEFCEAERATVPALLDSLLAAHAKDKGFRPPPKR